MSSQRHNPSIRLLVVGMLSLVLLIGVAFPVFEVFGTMFGRVLPAVLCIFSLVILMPVAFHGSGPHRVLAFLLALFPALLLLSIILFTSAFNR